MFCVKHNYVDSRHFLFMDHVMIRLTKEDGFWRDLIVWKKN